MKYSKNNLNVVVVQFTPIPRDVDGNIQKINKLLEKYKKDDKIDILLFPEMALTGYIFDSRDDVFPFLEEFNNGKTFDFCSNLANKLQSYVFLGYPEKVFDKEKNEEVCYNSCMIIDKDGNPYPSYRKHFLYEMDTTWCVEGPNFGCFSISTHSGITLKAGIGICMDLNPKEFKAPWEAMEFSSFCFKEDVDVILFLTNWLDNEPDCHSAKEVLHIINYWVNRLEPYLLNELAKPVYFLAANRCGKERETNFIGCSSAVKFEKGKKDPKLLNNLNKTKESAMIVTCTY